MDGKIKECENLCAYIHTYNLCAYIQTWSTYLPIIFKYFLISLCYAKCQNMLVNVLFHLLEHLSFWLRCPSFLLSKFASQLRLIHSVVRVGLLGICVTSSILRVLLSGFWVSGLQFQSLRDPFPRSWKGSRVPVSQSPGYQGHGFQVLILNYAK